MRKVVFVALRWIEKDAGNLPVPWKHVRDGQGAEDQDEHGRPGDSPKLIETQRIIP